MNRSAFKETRINIGPRPQIRGIAARMCLGITQLFLKPPLCRFNLRSKAQGGRFENADNYVADRVSNVEDYKRLFSEFASMRDKTVLELGCSSGYLLDTFLQQESFQAIGADIDPGALARGRRQYGRCINFVQSTPATIPVPSDSIDLIYSVDTIEHLSKPYEILTDAYRILRPGGQFIIHFCPCYAPSGAHLDDIIPFPWPHLLFSMDTLLDVAAYIYDSDDYSPACYWFDPETGRRRPNPFLDKKHWGEFLNDLSVRKFRRLLGRLPFETVELRKLGFGGKSYRIGRYFGWLGKLPVLDEVSIKAIFCVLRKPQS